MTSAEEPQIVPSGLIDDIRAADAAGLRRIAVAAAREALKWTGGEDITANALIDVVEDGLYGPSNERDMLQVLTVETDERYWAAVDAAEAAGDQDALEAATKIFCRARAFLSCWYAADPDGLKAAMESVYEAITATNNAKLIARAVHRVI
ncbi:hypothetical protein HMPREF1531_01188 [Propionibacterium sp. oral taxon 192 str. F0372]|uniref:hypothetical protein n=1 Tax=Propionibacterium sp. oral taxon 192 TaxID=671222 RepID=UPI0003544FA1|nr:hypothetical protein [Propionibacterium sp. oral taxon 192]EPH03763.1 hypothetical protein HMPREF1531_01188 [Propionibacterium sp. oral taxon 192 str. F0372]